MRHLKNVQNKLHLNAKSLMRGSCYMQNPETLRRLNFAQMDIDAATTNDDG